MPVAEAMLAYAFEAQKLTRKYFVVELDFSAGSIQDLERIADDVEFILSGGKSADNIQLLSRTWGSYLGEVICRTKGGTWVESESQPFGASIQAGDETLDPHEQVRQRLEGSGQSLVALYESIE